LRLVEVPLALELFFADAVRFIPVQFSEPNPTVPQSDTRAAFHLPPVALAIQPAEPRQIADSVACRDGLDIRNLAEELEIHRCGILSSRGCCFLDSAAFWAEEDLRTQAPERHFGASARQLAEAIGVQ
jgi:hypothetical protein